MVIHHKTLALLQGETQLIRVFADTLGELSQKAIFEVHLI